MDALAIAEFLQNNPRFFDQYAEIFGNLHVPHAHSEGTISLAERQLLTVRDKNRQLETKLAELIHYGKENDLTSEKVHLFSLDLIKASTLREVLNLVPQRLLAYFKLSAVAVRVWNCPSFGTEVLNAAQYPEFIATPSSDLGKYLGALKDPYHGPELPFEVKAWLDAYKNADVMLRSFALLPLRAPEIFGVVALASPDEQQFSASYGDFYLNRLEDLVTAALMRFLR